MPEEIPPQLRPGRREGNAKPGVLLPGAPQRRSSLLGRPFPSRRWKKEAPASVSQFPRLEEGRGAQREEEKEQRQRGSGEQEAGRRV
jgi:hypothetical protein